MADIREAHERALDCVSHGTRPVGSRGMIECYIAAMEAEGYVMVPVKANEVMREAAYAEMYNAFMTPEDMPERRRFNPNPLYEANVKARPRLEKM